MFTNVLLHILVILTTFNPFECQLTPSEPVVVNSLLDNLFVDIGNKEGIDPLPFLNNTVKGNLQVEGKIYGLKTISRTSDAQLEFRDKIINVKAGFLLKNLRAELIFFSRPFGMVGKTNLFLDSITIEVRLTGTLITGFKLSKLDVYRIGEIGVDVDGFGLLGALGEHVATIVSNKYKYQILDIVHAHLVFLINQELSKMAAEGNNLLF